MYINNYRGVADIIQMFGIVLLKMGSNKIAFVLHFIYMLYIMIILGNEHTITMSIHI